MFGRLKKQWCDFRRGRPGHRFQERFERNQRSRSTRSKFTRFLKPFLGIVLLVAGVVFCFIPGPGLPLVVIGAGLLADYVQSTKKEKKKNKMSNPPGPRTAFHIRLMRLKNPGCPCEKL